MGKKKLVAAVSAACFLSWFGMLVTVLSPSSNVGLTAVVFGVVMVFFFIILSGFVSILKVQASLLDDLAGWPPFLHYLVISMTALLLIIVVVYTTISYGKRRQQIP
ncbi:hypothetical protein EPO33_02975 [Patescibacteria group bacterium]|nr:MAG: hypothetical protein EPO33_02975 [Patescibacteria group bacterium]